MVVELRIALPLPLLLEVLALLVANVFREKTGIVIKSTKQNMVIDLVNKLFRVNLVSYIRSIYICFFRTWIFYTISISSSKRKIHQSLKENK